MLVPVFFDPSAFEDLPSYDTRALTALHQQVILALLRYGVFVLPRGLEGTGIVELVRHLPQGLRERWVESIPKLLTRQSDFGRIEFEKWIESSDYSSLPVGIDVIACGATIAELLEVYEQASADGNSLRLPEISRFDLVGECQAFSLARQLDETDVQQGENRVDVWETRFRPLAEAVRTVMVVDRYALKEFGRHRTTGLRWMAEQVNRSGVAQLTVITGCTPEDDLDEAKVNLIDSFRKLQPGNGSLRKVRWIFVRDQAFHHAHGRYVRFGEHHVILIEPGTDVFRTNTMRQTFPCQLVDAGSQLARERELRSRRIDELNIKISS